MYLPIIMRTWASSAGRAPNKIKVIGKKIHCTNTDILLNLLTPFGIGGRSIVLNSAETNIPIKEMVITLPVKIGKLNDKTVKLNFGPPSKIGNQPKTNNKSDAVAQDQ